MRVARRFGSDQRCVEGHAGVFDLETMRLRLAVGIAMLAIACGSAGGVGGSVGTPLTVNQLKFKVMDVVGIPVFCDPDYYPGARLRGGQAQADKYYPAIKAHAQPYSP